MSDLEPHRSASGRRALPVLALLLCLSPAIAEAIQGPQHLRGRAELELHPGASITAPRAVRARATDRRSPSALTIELGSAIASWDADTGVPIVLLPRGLDVPGASGSSAIAEPFARDLLARHIDTLAPGAAPADFALVSDVLGHDGVRTLGFVQHHAGLAVVGGQLSFSFKADRLIAIRSQALPDVRLPARAASIEPERAIAGAREWIADDFSAGDLDRTRVDGSVEGPMILPLVHEGGAVDYREVVAVEVIVDELPGRWRIWLDAETGQPIARRSLIEFAEIRMDTWVRSPLQGDRSPFPAGDLEVVVDGQQTWTDALGLVDLGPGGAFVEFRPEGRYAQVSSESGPVASVATLLGPGQSFVWDLGADPEQDAQLSGYVHTQLVKDYIRAIDPNFAPLAEQTLVTVNIDDTCNAFADQGTLNFYLEGGGCQNSALVADVIYHEYGHVAHILGMQPGVGLFDGGVSEGASDYLASTITGDSALGVGFFLDGDWPIRDNDPDGFEHRWPEDAGEVHDEGQILAGTLWDLRTALIDKYGPALGIAKTDAIWLGGIQRSIDMPSWYVEALLTNDDDGDLNDGTPDICEIDAAFAGHGLYQPFGVDVEVEEVALPDGGVEVTLTHGLPFAGCPGSLDPHAVLHYRPRPEPGDPAQPATELAMTEVGTGLLRGVIPPRPIHTVTQYQVELDWGNGASALRPDNRADEWYEFFSGPITEIWCSDFEPGGGGWTLEGEWDIGTPAGGGGDPGEAWSGTTVAGNNLPWPGLYSPNRSSTLRSPLIDVSGHEVVRLQYRRWLTVEDGYWDHASIAVNDQLAWQNRGSEIEELASIHHRDREWRFHDVELTPHLRPDGQLWVEFMLETDAGLELGGWNVDDLCIVGHGVPAGGCGDGYRQPTEQCDDGNLDNGDGCSSGCLLEDDGPLPPEEPIDELDWDPQGRGCACELGDPPRQTGTGGLGGLALLGLIGLGLRRRRTS